MSRRPFVAGNWKLNCGPRAARELAAALRSALGAEEDVDVAVFPPALSLAPVIETLKGTPIHTGVQWASPHQSGAYTGTNSAEHARELGAAYLLAGHSEVRRDLGATDERINASIKAGLAAGLLPMLCIGESLDDRDEGRLELILERQLQIGLSGLTPDQVVTCTLAYEPIWAIGTGRTASPAQAQEAHAFIRGWLRKAYPSVVADQLRVLYGGSVKPSNAAELLSQPDIDGALVGGASLAAESFAGIVAGART